MHFLQMKWKTAFKSTLPEMLNLQILMEHIHHNPMVFESKRLGLKMNNGTSVFGMYIALE